VKSSITTRFSTAVVLVSGFILLVIVGINFLFIKNQLIETANTKAKFEIYKSQNRINRILYHAINSCESAKAMLSRVDFDKSKISHTLEQTLRQNPNIYGMAVAMEPDVIYKKPFCPYYHKSGQDIHYVNLATRSYDYLKQPWYSDVNKIRSAKWSEPYFDEGGGEILMATYSNPIFADGKFAGVVTIDLSLESLSRIISSIHILDSGYAFLLSKDRTVLVHPKSSLIMTEYRDKIIRFDKIIKEDKQWIYYTKIDSTGWILGIVLPQKELFSSLYQITTISMLLALLGVLALIVTIFIVSSKITKPLKRVIEKSIDISNGNFDQHIEKSEIKDEIYQLSTAINRMQDDIKSYIENLKIATIKEEKRKSELDIANKIQMDMLPIAQDCDLESRVRLYASLNPAREVGGDFYDFFYLDEDRLCFVVADVSGKGVPAALFMAVAISYIRAYSSGETSPSAIVQKVNNALCINNEASMFVTLFIGIIDLNSGKLSYVNAGHPKPYLHSASKDSYQIESANDPVVGAMEDMDFQEFSIILQRGDRLFIYTDGVNEAFSKEGKQFGEKRLKSLLDTLSSLSSDRVLCEIRQNIDVFCIDEPQSDDITMMLLDVTI